MSGDFDGDGRADTLTQKKDCGWPSDCYVVHHAAGGKFALKSNEQLGNSGAGVFDAHVADVNGDGRDDVILHQKQCSQNCLRVKLSQPGGTKFAEVDGSDHSVRGSNNWKLIIADFNGDGRADTVEQKINCRAPSDYYNIHLGGSDGRFGKFKGERIGHSGTVFNLVASDFTGDGRDDLLLQNRNCKNPELCYLIKRPRADGTGFDVIGQRNEGMPVQMALASYPPLTTGSESTEDRRTNRANCNLRYDSRLR